MRMCIYRTVATTLTLLALNAPGFDPSDSDTAQAATQENPPLGGPRSFSHGKASVSSGSLQGRYQVTDFAHNSSVGIFELNRLYVQDAAVFRDNTPTSPFFGSTPSGDSATIRWFSSAETHARLLGTAYVRRNADGTYSRVPTRYDCRPPLYECEPEPPFEEPVQWVVIDANGGRHAFTPCTTAIVEGATEPIADPYGLASCWAMPEERNPEIRLQWAADRDAFVFHQGQSRYTYSRTTGYRIASIEGYQLGSSAARPIALFEYGKAGVAGTPCDIDMLLRIRLTDTTLSFQYAVHSELGCVLNSVSATTGTTAQTIASYSYSGRSTTLSNGKVVASPAYLTSATILSGAGAPETYSYVDPASESGRKWFRVSRRAPDGNHVASLQFLISLQGSYVSDIWSPFPDVYGSQAKIYEATNVDGSPRTCLPGQLDGTSTYAWDPSGYRLACPRDQTQYEERKETRGDGSGALITRRSAYTVTASNLQPGTYTSKIVDTCTDGASCNSSTQEWIIGEAFGVPVNQSHFNGYGWTLFDYSAATYSPAGTPPTVHLASLREGASNAGSTDPLRITNFEYSFNDGANGAGEAQLTRVRRASLLPGGAVEALVSNVWDRHHNRLVATVVTGDTQDSEGRLVTRHVGTFYNTARTCLGSEAAADPYGRILEVVGPCEVASPSATGCAVGTNIPVTQYEYQPSVDGTANVSALASRTVFVEGVKLTEGGSLDCEGAKQHVTRYAEYDQRGRPTRVEDPNGAVRVYVYRGDHLVKETGPEGVTDYEYDIFGHLTAKRGPGLTAEQYCYRTNSDLTCSTGSYSGRLHWSATTPRDGTAQNDSPFRTIYEYNASTGGLTGQHLYAGGAYAQFRELEPDPRGKPAFEKLGDVPNDYASHTVYTFDGRPLAHGFPYNLPSTGGFGNTCRNAQGALRVDCMRMYYNRLGLLARAVDAPEANGPEANTCVDWDAHGNISAIAYGCSASEGCENCPESKRVRYTHDDFGNVVTVVAPWAQTPTRLAYDAAGNLIGQRDSAAVTHAFDGLGRRRFTALPADGGTLFSMDYDDATSPTNCAASSSGSSHKGSVRRISDVVGDHWYEYDVRGRVTGIYTDRTEANGCYAKSVDRITGDREAWPSRRFTYDGERLSAETLPHGRTIYYEYGTGARSNQIQSVKIDLFSLTNGSLTATTHTLVRNIKWHPDGQVQSYELVLPRAGAASSTVHVETLMGASTANNPLSCGAITPVETSDRSLRPRDLWISRGTVRSGDLLRKRYTWASDQVVQEESCLLGVKQTTYKHQPLRESGPGYDRRMQLRHTSAEVVAGVNQAVTDAGVYARRDFAYDLRGNRTRDVEDCFCFENAFESGRTDVLSSRRLTTTGAPATSACACKLPQHSVLLAYDYSYDSVGRMTHKYWPYDSNGEPNYWQVFDTTDDESNAALGTVYRSVDVGGRPYQYFYDAAGRRRMKRQPLGADEEYFYDGTNLIEDRGLESSEHLSSAPRFPIDEYVWLSGKPIAVIKSQFARTAGAWSRQPDSVGTCTRAGEGVPCGVYGIVADHIGKPIVVLNADAKVAGYFEYQPHGHVNRVTSVAGYEYRGYGDDSAGANHVIANYRQNRGPSVAVQMRLRFALADMETDDRVVLTSIDGTTRRTTPSGAPFEYWGETGSTRVSSWASVPNDGVVHARFFAGTTSSAGSPRRGVLVEAYEYRIAEHGVAPIELPLRFPGQYYDSETDLFENWNRFYDPSAGRYLSPEPLLTDPQYVVERALEGRSSPVYAYAGNNPIMFTDPDGLDVKNESDREIVIKPDTDGKVVIINADGEMREIEVKAGDAVTLAPGETYAGPQDGLADPEMRGGVVMKTVNGYDATVKADGTVELSRNPNLSIVGATKAAAGQLLVGGWQNTVWNQNLNEKGDTGWNAIFEQSLRNGYVVRRWP